jgi:hypothetical protein
MATTKRQLDKFITKALDHTHDFFAALEELSANSVYVGVPSTRINRDPEPGEKNTQNNAVIGYVMENGDPDKNVPARPFLVPGVRENQKAIVERLRAIGKAALSGELGKVKSLRVQLGLFAQRAVQQKITDGPFQPLAEATLEARVRRRFGKGAAGSRKGARIELARRAAGLAPGTDFARPLIDTGQLRRAIQGITAPTRNRKKTITAFEGDYRSALANATKPPATP